MMDRTKLKVAVIGAGYTAKEHVRAFADIDRVELSGVFSRTRSRAETLASENGIRKVCGSVRELWEEGNPDIVVVTVNEPSIKEVMEECLTSPWKILVEKPPTLYVEWAKELDERSRKEGREVRVALNRACYSVTRAVSAEIRGNKGKRFIFVQDQEDPERALAAGQPKEVADRWMYANSIHMVDYFRIFSKGKAVSVDVKKPFEDSKPCLVEASIGFDNGDHGTYQALWNEPGPWGVAVSLPDVRYELRPLEEGRRQVRGSRPEQIEADNWDKSFKPGFRKQAEEMVRLAEEGSCDIPTLGDAIQTMELIKRIYGK